MRICIIGKQAFGAEVYSQLLKAGHEIVLVCTELDKNGRADLIALEAAKNNTPVLKVKSWRRKNADTGKWEVVSEVFEEYKKYKPELNVLPFCTQFIPQEVIDFPRHKSIIYHPSLLPAHRGASAINWTLICGDAEAGLTVFWADSGVDTGPILLQRQCRVEENDTLDSLYKRFLYPEGVKAMVEAVNLITAGKAPPESHNRRKGPPTSHTSQPNRSWLKSSGLSMGRINAGCTTSFGAMTLCRGRGHV